MSKKSLWYPQPLKLGDHLSLQKDVEDRVVTPHALCLGLIRKHGAQCSCKGFIDFHAFELLADKHYLSSVFFL